MRMFVLPAALIYEQRIAGIKSKAFKAQSAFSHLWQNSFDGATMQEYPFRWYRLYSSKRHHLFCCFHTQNRNATENIPTQKFYQSVRLRHKQLPPPAWLKIGVYFLLSTIATSQFYCCHSYQIVQYYPTLEIDR